MPGLGNLGRRPRRRRRPLFGAAGAQKAAPNGPRGATSAAGAGGPARGGAVPRAATSLRRVATTRAAPLLGPSGESVRTFAQLGVMGRPRAEQSEVGARGRPSSPSRRGRPRRRGERPDVAASAAVGQPRLPTAACILHHPRSLAAAAAAAASSSSSRRPAAAGARRRASARVHLEPESRRSRRGAACGAGDVLGRAGRWYIGEGVPPRVAHRSDRRTAAVSDKVACVGRGTGLGRRPQLDDCGTRVGSRVCRRASATPRDLRRREAAVTGPGDPACQLCVRPSACARPCSCGRLSEARRTGKDVYAAVPLYSRNAAGFRFFRTARGLSFGRARFSVLRAVLCCSLEDARRGVTPASCATPTFQTSDDTVSVRKAAGKEASGDVNGSHAPLDDSPVTSLASPEGILLGDKDQLSSAVADDVSNSGDKKEKEDSAGSGKARKLDAPGFAKTAEREKARREKISAANKGRVPWNKGKKRSEETKRKIAASLSKTYQSPEVSAGAVAVPQYPLCAYKHAVALAVAGELTKASEAFYARKRAQKEEEERQRRIEAGLPPEPPPEEQAAVQAKKKAKAGKPVLPTVSTEPAPGEALGKREVQGLKDQQGLLASDSEEPKRKRKQVRSEAHRRAISEAIKKKWQDPQYQERQRQGMRRHFGQRTPKAVSADKRKAKQQTPRVQLTERERKLQMMAREARRLSERAEARVRLLREMVANGQPVRCVSRAGRHGPRKVNSSVNRLGRFPAKTFRRHRRTSIMHILYWHEHEGPPQPNRRLSARHNVRVAQ
eukprot:scaffold1896_cov331-Prasinococcus_capsulatus_cf.AAC.5